MANKPTVAQPPQPSPGPSGSHTRCVYFRKPDEVDKLTAILAARNGCSLSSLLSQLVRQVVDAVEKTEPNNRHIKFDAELWL